MLGVNQVPVVTCAGPAAPACVVNISAGTSAGHWTFPIPVFTTNPDQSFAFTLLNQTSSLWGGPNLVFNVTNSGLLFLSSGTPSFQSSRCGRCATWDGDTFQFSVASRAWDLVDNTSLPCCPASAADLVSPAINVTFTVAAVGLLGPGQSTVATVTIVVQGNGPGWPLCAHRVVY